MITRYVIIHLEWGIFVGAAGGGAFWSRMHPAGQDHAVTFESPEEVVKYLATWKPDAPKGLRAVPVQVDDDSSHATIAQCVAAGLPEWDPDFELAGGSIQGELASIIEKVDRLISDAAAVGDEDYASRVAVICRTLSNAAARRGGAIKRRLEGSIDRALLLEAASQDALERATSVLDDEKWNAWKNEDKVPTPEVRLVRSSHDDDGDELDDDDDDEDSRVVN